MLDYLIVGQGLAGSVLAYHLKKRGASFAIVDNNHSRSATKVAAGHVDYISGKRLTLSWRAETLIPHARAFYKKLEKELGLNFFYDMPSKRLFTTQVEANVFAKKRELDTFSGFYGELIGSHDDENIIAPFGGVHVLGSCCLDTKVFLSAMADYLKEHIYHAEMDYEQLDVSHDRVVFGDIVAKKVLFCNGYHVYKTPWFKDLGYRMAKGETLTLKNWGLDDTVAYKFGRWMVPRHSGHLKCGATYEWDDINTDTSEKGKLALLNHLKKHFICQPEIVAHEAGVRCMVKNLRPIIGYHPHFSHVGIFNGFSSKGVMMVPYFAEQWMQMEFNGGKLDTEVDVKREFTSCE
jgi:glycine oxidase